MAQRRWRGSSRSPWNATRQTQRAPSPELGDPLAQVDWKDLEDSGNDNVPAKITTSKYIASYNWLNKKEPEILIPGKPPAWKPPPQPTQLLQDSGEYFRDQNSARYPSHPLQPAVEAIFTENPTFPTKTIDIVACGGTLGNLLRFSRGIDKSFRMSVELVGSTVFFIRRENSPTELIDGVRGYGHTFPEAYTTWDDMVKGSQSHQRIIQYTFGGLRCLVRFEADGYHPNMIAENTENITPEKKTSPEEDDPNNALASALGGASIGIYSSMNSKKQSLIIQRRGESVPQDAIFDLKTRAYWKKEDILEGELPRLWLLQIPNFVLGYHKSGLFEDIKTINTQNQIKIWEDDNKIALRRLIALLGKLVSFARGRVDGRFELRRKEGSSYLELREQCDDVEKALPVHLAERWGMEAVDIYLLSDESSQPSSEREIDHSTWTWEDDSEKDFTACSVDYCGYCGHCKY